MQQYLLGYDLGSSSVKVSIVDARTGKTIAAAQSPAEEMPMVAVKPGWAEQDPEMWWEHAVKSTQACLKKAHVKGDDVVAIGISYQMHGLVCVDKDQKIVRPSIIWCDSRAVETGEKAGATLGHQYCLHHFLNAPGNFTASKLAWVKNNEPDLYSRIHKVMLPGDYLAMRLSGSINTTETGLSEGIMWDFEKQGLADTLLETYGIASSLLADRVGVFDRQSEVNAYAAEILGLKAGTPISYRAGDQPNNAFSLNVLKPGETAATAGTSGVIYSVTDKNAFDPKSRVNTFIHVNNKSKGAELRNGVLLCINGTGILNSWLRRNLKAGDENYQYQKMNEIAAGSTIGSDGLVVLPFGNGAERVLENRNVNGSFLGLNFNRHDQSHILRAAQEGIVFALKYGFDVLREIGVQSSVIRAGHANMFLSPIFREAFVNTIGARLELYDTDGSKGAALGAGVGAGIYDSFEEAFRGFTLIQSEDPDPKKQSAYKDAYARWNTELQNQLANQTHTK
jgi:xylulokinase